MNLSVTASGLSPTETETFTTSAANATVCVQQENTPVRSVALVVSSIAVLENGVLLIAMIAYWPKFLSNLYRFVASLLCADLLVAVFAILMHILNFYNTSSAAIAYIKGTFATMHMVSTVSVSLVNMGVFFTYSRFTTRLLEQQAANAEDTYISRVRHYFRKPVAAYILIAGIWTLGAVFMVLSVLLRCRAETHGCLESCATVVRRGSSDKESAVCTSHACNKFLAPLSSYYTLSVIIMFWVSFVFLIASTLTVVCVKVNVKLAGKTSSVNNGFVEGEEKRLPSVQDSESVDNNGFVEDEEKRLPSVKDYESASNNSFVESEEKKLPSVEDYESGKTSKQGDDVTGTDVKKFTQPENPTGQRRRIQHKPSIHYTITRSVGFNKDLMSRFSLLITTTQCIFWMPVTAIILYTMIANKTFASFRTYEIMLLYFELPTILNPWICFTTMSKLRDAIFSMYYSITH